MVTDRLDDARWWRPGRLGRVGFELRRSLELALADVGRGADLVSVARRWLAPKTVWIAEAMPPRSGVALIDRRTTAFAVEAGAGVPGMALHVRGSEQPSASFLHGFFIFGAHVLPRYHANAHLALRYLPVRCAETLALLCSGCTDSEAADHMGVSRTTLRTHVASLFTLFGVASRGELLAVPAIAACFGMPIVTVASSGRARLSARELAVARCLRAGLSQKEVAVALGLSTHTVHGYVKAIHRRLGLRRTTDLRLMHGLDSLDEPSVDPDLAKRGAPSSSLAV